MIYKTNSKKNADKKFQYLVDIDRDRFDAAFDESGILCAGSLFLQWADKSLGKEDIDWIYTLVLTKNKRDLDHFFCFASLEKAKILDVAFGSKNTDNLKSLETSKWTAC